MYHLARARQEPIGPNNERLQPPNISSSRERIVGDPTVRL